MIALVRPASGQRVPARPWRPAPRSPPGVVATAAGPVEVVAERVLPVVVLVILPGGPEPGGGRDLGHHRLAQALRDRALGLLGQAALRLVMGEDAGAVLAADVTELGVGGRRNGKSGPYSLSRGLLPGCSVPCFLRTVNCTGVRRCRHSASVIVTSNVLTGFLAAGPSAPPCRVPSPTAPIPSIISSTRRLIMSGLPPSPVAPPACWRIMPLGGLRESRRCQLWRDRR